MPQAPTGETLPAGMPAPVEENQGSFEGMGPSAPPEPHHGSPVATEGESEAAAPPSESSSGEDEPAKKSRRLWWRKRSPRSRTPRGGPGGPEGGEGA
jgi:hypothetical protein